MAALSDQPPMGTPRHFLDLDRVAADDLRRMLDRGLAFPAYDWCMKCSHAFNVLDARGAISVTERQSYIGRVRALARGCAKAYLEGGAATVAGG